MPPRAECLECGATFETQDMNSLIAKEVVHQKIDHTEFDTCSFEGTDERTERSFFHLVEGGVLIVDLRD